MWSRKQIKVLAISQRFQNQKKYQGTKLLFKGENKNTFNMLSAFHTECTIHVSSNYRAPDSLHLKEMPHLLQSFNTMQGRQLCEELEVATNSLVGWTGGEV